MTIDPPGWRSLDDTAARDLAARIASSTGSEPTAEDHPNVFGLRLGLDQCHAERTSRDAVAEFVVRGQAGAAGRPDMTIRTRPAIDLRHVLTGR